jgi:hypothetical protein
MGILFLGSSFVSVAETSRNRTASPVKFSVCYDFTCRTEEDVTLSASQWDSVVRIFRAPSTSGSEERLRIQEAIGRMEQVVGFHTPTHRDLPRNYQSKDPALADLPGQMDCIDESINTTTYLELFEKHGLLKRHRVLPRAYRRALLNQHWAGHIEEIETGERFVVDSWFYENGVPPYIVRSEDWHDLSPFRFARNRNRDRASVFDTE